MRGRGQAPKVLSQTIDDVSLQYLEYGGAPPAILMLHATGFSPWMWHPIARDLCRAHRIVAPYFCDHRQTDPEDGGLSWMILAQDLAAFCARLDLGGAVLVGHSMGATVLALAVGLYGLTPPGMILIEPIFLPQDFYRVQLKVEEHPLASKSIRRRDHWQSTAEAEEYLRSKALFRRWDDEMLSLYVQHGMRQADDGELKLVCSPRREAALFMGGMHFDPWPVLGRVSCPVLILEGQESENRSYIDLHKAAGLFPQGEFRQVPEAGHLIPMERPRETTRLICEFLERI